MPTARTKKAAEPASVVASRRPDDCLITGLANALGWTYERAAEVLGYPCNPADGLPMLPLVRGLSMQQAAAPLFATGISATWILTKEHPQLLAADAGGHALELARAGLYSSNRLKTLIAGRPAIVSGDWGPGAEVSTIAKGHALAWDGARLIGDGAPADLATATLWDALILTPTPGKRAPAKTPPTPAPTGATLAEAVERHERVFLSFSGGKESIVLAHMCEAHREKVTLVWVRVQHAAPHMVDFIRGYAERGWRLEEIRAPSMSTHWQAAGIPAEVVSVEHAQGLREPRMQTVVSCCHALRQAPLNAFMHAQGEPCALVHGQRSADRGGATHDGLRWQLPASVEIVQPLLDWSEADVMAYVAEHGLELPHQYAEGCSDSLECLPCPVMATPERMAFLDRHYPVAASITRKTIRKTGMAATMAILDTFNTAGVVVPTGAAQ